MSDYQRFVSYIYEYSGKKKSGNTGFAKVESRNGVCRMQIHLQGIEEGEGMLEICAFVREGDWLRGISLGKVPAAAPVTEIRLMTPADHVGNVDYSMENLSGLWISSEKGGTYLSIWDEEPVDLDKLVTRIPDENPDDEGEGSESKEEESASPDPEQGQSDEKEELTAETEEDGKKQEQKLQVQEAAACPVSQGRCSGCQSCLSCADRGWERLSEQSFHVQPFEGEETQDCIRISPGDLGALFRSPGQMGRNSFLWHGYYNYRHLLLARCRDGSYFLGIPGILENQERMMAGMFGFPQFRKAKEPGGSRAPFGYWCRNL